MFYILKFFNSSTSLCLIVLLAIASPVWADSDEPKAIGPLERLIKSGRLSAGRLPAVPLDKRLSPDYVALFASRNQSKEAIVWLISHLESFNPNRISAEHLRNFVVAHYPLGRGSRMDFDLIVYMPRPEAKELAALGLLLEIQELIPPPSQIEKKGEVSLPGHKASLVEVRDGRCFLEIPSAEETLIFLHANDCSYPKLLIDTARKLNLTRFRAKLTY